MIELINANKSFPPPSRARRGESAPVDTGGDHHQRGERGCDRVRGGGGGGGRDNALAPVGSGSSRCQWDDVAPGEIVPIGRRRSPECQSRLQ